MTYIGGTLSAPTGFNHDAFKAMFENLVTTALEVDEPSAIGTGNPTTGNAVHLNIKSVHIEPEGVEALQRILGSFYLSHSVTVESTGTAEVTLKPDFASALGEGLEAFRDGQRQAMRLRDERVQRDAEDRRIAGLSDDELRAEGRYEELERRQQAAADAEPEWYG